MENKNLSGNDSLEIITRMISTAKYELEDDSFFYLLWGWLVFAACVINFVLLKMNSSFEGISWVILMPLGGIISFVYGMKQRKKSRVKTYIDEIMKYVLISFGVSLSVVLFFGSRLGLNTYPMVMLIYGMWLFVSGSALKFRPIIIGGIINWTLAVVSFFYGFEDQLLILGMAVLLGYIIPGHMLKIKFRNRNVLVNDL